MTQRHETARTTGIKTSVPSIRQWPKHRFKIRKESIDSLFRHKASLTERRFSDVCLTESSKTELALVPSPIPTSLAFSTVFQCSSVTSLISDLQLNSYKISPSRAKCAEGTSSLKMKLDE